MKKVSFVCTTYRRFTCVERIIAQYHAQTYPNKELIIFNTDIEHPLTLGFEDASIVVKNNNIDYVTNEPYKNRGQICRDAVVHATGDYFMLADDDDIYLPWHLQQAVDGIESLGTDAWKPEKSFFAQPNKLSMARNVMEASVIVKMSRIREIGFRTDLTGFEGLSWYTKLRDEKQLNEHNEYYVPSYCFNWSDPKEIAGHKQSGDINNPNNFENHKLQSMDYATRPLQKDMDLTSVYKKYYDFYKENIEQFNMELIEKYVAKHLI
jgi:glycosyltransferase involved in cell wall biosynthesis